MTKKEMIDYIDTLEEQNGRVIKEKEELIRQLKAKTLSPETIEVIRDCIDNMEIDIGKHLTNARFKQARQEFTAAYGEEQE
jgi:hypothetical protein